MGARRAGSPDEVTWQSSLCGVQNIAAAMVTDARRVSPRRARYFLAARQENIQRIAPRRPGPAGFPPSEPPARPAAKLATLRQRVRTAPVRRSSARRERGDGCIKFSAALSISESRLQFERFRLAPTRAGRVIPANVGALQRLPSCPYDRCLIRRPESDNLVVIHYLRGISSVSVLLIITRTFLRLSSCWVSQ